LADLLGARTEFNLSDLMHYRGPVSAFQALLKHMGTNIAELPMDLRCDLAIKLSEDLRFNSPELFSLTLHCDPAVTLMNYQNKHGTTLLHAVARALGVLSGYNNTESAYWTDIKDREKRISGWKSILQALVAGGADLHVTCQVPRLEIQASPFLFMFCNRFYCYYSLVESTRVNPQHALDFWITTLSDSGVDLTIYGQRERSIWNSADILLKPWHNDPWDPLSDYYIGERRLISFDYGSLPKNWKLWENEPTDEFAGDFWLMLDRKDETMPGTWID
jgi:hypothetical protein